MRCTALLLFLLLVRPLAAQSVAEAKAALQAQPQSLELSLQLARAYVQEANELWALRTLGKLAQSHPDTCQPRLWLAWVQLRQGGLGDAQATLGQGCPAGPEEARRLLLLAMVFQGLNSPSEARTAVQSARRQSALFPEDRQALLDLQPRADAGYLYPVSGRLELVGGYSSNASAGSPTEAASRGDQGSPLAQANALLRFVAPTGRLARPILDLELRSLGFSDPVGQELSYLLFSPRPGVHFGDAGVTGLLAYRFEGLVLAGGDRYGQGPLLFYNGHRVEGELNPLPGLTLFSGVGRRLFRNTARTRDEVDGGLGGGLPLARNLRLLGALTGRYHSASHSAWNLHGGSLLLSSEYRLPRAFSVRLGLLGSWDRYPDSRGYFDPAHPARSREDLLGRLSLSLFSPVWQGLKGGLTWEYGRRDSSADPYDYQEQRLLARLIWAFQADPFLPPERSPKGHVRLPFEAGGAAFEERIQDLLRQDEAVQRSSSCVE
jgi:hypothetical protein